MSWPFLSGISQFRVNIFTFSTENRNVLTTPLRSFLWNSDNFFAVWQFLHSLFAIKHENRTHFGQFDQSCPVIDRSLPHMRLPIAWIFHKINEESMLYHNLYFDCGPLLSGCFFCETSLKKELNLSTWARIQSYYELFVSSLRTLRCLIFAQAN